LPFVAIELANNAVEFGAFGEYWRCRLDDYACERAEFSPPGSPLDVPSPDTKVAVSRRGYDLWARSLSDGREWALTTDGEPDYQYGSGPDSTSNGTLLRKFGLPCGIRSGTAGVTCTGTTYAPAHCSGRSPAGNGR
jgi:dipeptidyl-peptidase-4